MPRKTVAQLEAQVTDLEQRLSEERTRGIQQRTEITEARKERDQALLEARAAEREQSRLQGYIDRVREEQGVRVGEIEMKPRWGPGHPDFDRFVHGQDYRHGR